MRAFDVADADAAGLGGPAFRAPEGCRVPQARGPHADFLVQVTRRLQPRRTAQHRQKSHSVIAASAGNRARGVAYAAAKLGLRARVVYAQNHTRY